MTDNKKNKEINQNNEKLLSITHFHPKKETLIINVIKESGSSVEYTSNDESSPHQKKIISGLFLID